MAAPAMALVGWTVKASLVAAAGVMLNALLVAPVSARGARGQRVARAHLVDGQVGERRHAGRPRTPCVVPESVPPPGLVPMAIVMVAVELVTVLSFASCTVTWIAGATLAPAAALRRLHRERQLRSPRRR